MNWYKRAQFDNGFFSNDKILLATKSIQICPCCGEDKVKINAVDDWNKCRNTLECPLSNAGGYFKNKPYLIAEIPGLGILELSGDAILKAREWANNYKRQAGTPSIDIGDVGVIVNSQHAWNNGKKIVIVDKHEFVDDAYVARSVEPDTYGVYFLYPENIRNFEEEWKYNPQDLIGMTVIINGQAELHPHTDPNTQTDGEKVTIVSYLNNKNKWGARSNELNGYSYHTISPTTFKKIKD